MMCIAETHWKASQKMRAASLFYVSLLGASSPATERRQYPAAAVDCSRARDTRMPGKVRLLALHETRAQVHRYQGFTACVRLAWERVKAALLRDDAGRERRALLDASRSDASRSAATATRCVRDTRGAPTERHVSHAADC